MYPGNIHPGNMHHGHNHGHNHFRYIHHGYMHHGYMHNGYLHHGYMHHGYVHHGYMHHQQSESRIHACVHAWVTRPERPKGAKDEVKQARRVQSRGASGGVCPCVRPGVRLCVCPGVRSWVRPGVRWTSSWAPDFGLDLRSNRMGCGFKLNH